jgi:hypothetical protein
MIEDQHQGGYKILKIGNRLIQFPQSPGKTKKVSFADSFKIPISPYLPVSKKKIIPHENLDLLFTKLKPIPRFLWALNTNNLQTRNIMQQLREPGIRGDASRDLA